MATSCHIAMFNGSLAAYTLGIGCLLSSYTLMTMNSNRLLQEMLGMPTGAKYFGAMISGFQDIKSRRHVHGKPVNARIV